jgi:hypothetical protein
MSVMVPLSLILAALLLLLIVFVGRMASRSWLSLVFNAWADAVRSER